MSGLHFPVLVTIWPEVADTNAEPREKGNILRTELVVGCKGYRGDLLDTRTRGGRAKYLEIYRKIESPCKESECVEEH